MMRFVSVNVGRNCWFKEKINWETLHLLISSLKCLDKKEALWVYFSLNGSVYVSHNHPLWSTNIQRSTAAFAIVHNNQELQNTSRVRWYKATIKRPQNLWSQILFLVIISSDILPRQLSAAKLKTAILTATSVERIQPVFVLSCHLEGRERDALI